MNTVDELLEYNRGWAERARVEDPQYFDRMALSQSPTVLWIGCSDSRVPPSVITGARPGMLFMHRNIANLAIHSDVSFLAVLEYSVDVLKVDHIVVAGHYNCGGVKAACSNKPAPDMVDHWIQHIRDIKRVHQIELDGIADVQQREDRLVELNVIEQVRNIEGTTTVTGGAAREPGAGAVITRLSIRNGNGRAETRLAGLKSCYYTV
jgi:carbonic anhydrase